MPMPDILQKIKDKIPTDCYSCDNTYFVDQEKFCACYSNAGAETPDDKRLSNCEYEENFKDSELLYKAGKADALPPWPPEDGKVFYYLDEVEQLGYLLEVRNFRWWATCTWDDSAGQIDGPNSGWASDFDLPIEIIQRLYDAGQLQEVKP